MSLFGGVLSIKGVAFLIFSILLVSVLGYALGRIKIKGVSLGTAGVFIVALVYGVVFYPLLSSELFVRVGENGETYVSSALKVVENLGLILFVTSVGFIAGPNFFSNFKKNFKSYVLIALVIIISGGLTCAACIAIGQNFTELNNKEFTAMLVGLLSGSLTSTPAFSAAKATAANVSPELENFISVGHGIAYLFGVVGVVLFVQLMPKLLKADMNVERSYLKAAEKEDKNKKPYDKKLFEFDEFGFFPFCVAAALGVFVGSIKGFNFSLTTTGGCLLVSLIFGHFGRFGRISVMPKEHVLKTFREFGLLLFLVGAGIAGGASFVKYFNGIYFVYGVIMTVVPMIIGFIFAKFALKLKLLNNLGSITGGMTSTPALGALIGSSGTEDVAASYAATYPVALVSVVIVSEVLILIFGQ